MKRFIGLYIAILSSIWLPLEIYTSIQETTLKQMWGISSWVIFVIPLPITFVMETLQEKYVDKTTNNVRFEGELGKTNNGIFARMLGRALDGAFFGAIFGAILGVIGGTISGTFEDVVFGAFFGAFLGAIVWAILGRLVEQLMGQFLGQFLAHLLAY